MGASEELRSFVHSVVTGLSNTPQGVKTEAIDAGEKSLCIVVSCHSHDMGFVIGKQGRNAQAIRTLLQSMAAKHGLKSTLIVKE